MLDDSSLFCFALPPVGNKKHLSMAFLSNSKREIDREGGVEREERDRDREGGGEKVRE